jgi:hypothetical protein
MSAPGERDRASPLVVSAAAVLMVACASVNTGGGAAGSAGDDTGQAGSAVSGTGLLGASGMGGTNNLYTGVAGAAGTFGVPRCQGPCTDFPMDMPFFEGGATPDSPAMFASPAVGLGPCITEPEDGALFPNNWLRPRVKFKPAVPGTLHEIRFHSDQEANDLVAYTTNDSWTMPRALWSALSANVQDTPITITVRAAGGGASTSTFTIAPVPAPGSVVFWAANPADRGAPKPTSSSLQGFAPGDEGTVTTLSVGDVQMRTRSQNNAMRPVTCIGCHNSTPSGDAVAFIDNLPWGMAIASVEPGRTGLIPSYVTVGGQDAMRQPGLGIFSFSKAYWSDGQRKAVVPYFLPMACGPYMQENMFARLAWIDLAAQATDNGCPVEGRDFGIIARDGDTRGAANPAWSPDGQTIVYSSTTAGRDGRLEVGPSDLYVVPYNDGAGGPAVPLTGAAEPDFEEYYPTFSPDGALVIFDRIPAGGVMYANPMAELFVVPSTGAPAATRLVANDPPACSGFASPGVNNHWAKWAPDPPIAAATGKKYYWMIFSSNRAGIPPVIADNNTVVQVSQLYATAIVVDGGSMQTYPAIYLWNQNPATLNTTPAWDPFQIPIVP